MTTIRELIKILNQLPPDNEIGLTNFDENGVDTFVADLSVVAQYDGVEVHYYITSDAEILTEYFQFEVIK